MARRWLVKCDPGTYGFADLRREGETAWDGIGNPLALRHLAAMRPGDEVLVYHTGREKAVVGTAKVAATPQGGAPRLAAGAPLARPVPLARLREEPALAGWDLLRQPRLSVLPVPATAWRRVLALAAVSDPPSGRRARP